MNYKLIINDLFQSNEFNLVQASSKLCCLTNKFIVFIFKLNFCQLENNFVNKMFVNNFKLQILFDTLVPKKSMECHERYFSNLYEFSKSKTVPGSIKLIKISYLIKVVGFVVFASVNLSHHTRQFLLDYCYLSHLGDQFNLSSIFLYSSAFFIIPNLLEGANSSDFIGLTYQTVILKQYKNLFLFKTDKKGSLISHKIEKFFTKLSDAFVGNNLICCKLKC